MNYVVTLIKFMMSSSMRFKPLPPLQEEEEEVEDDLTRLISLALHLHGGRLFENELWAVCRECVISLKSIEDTDLFNRTCICPESITFNQSGEIFYVHHADPNSEFLPPEYNTSGPSFKGHLYSLARCLLEAAEFNLPADQQVEISNDLLGLITLMSLDDPSRRPSYKEIIATCLEHLGDESSQEICRNLSSVGRNVVKQSSLKSAYCSRENDVGLNLGIQEPDGNEKDNDPKELIADTMNSTRIKDDAQNVAAFDNLSQRAQEILKKIYTGAEISRDSIPKVGPEETSQTEGPSKTLPNQSSVDSKGISDGLQRETSNKITKSSKGPQKMSSGVGRRHNDELFLGRYTSGSLINKVSKSKHCDGKTDETIGGELEGIQKDHVYPPVIRITETKGNNVNSLESKLGSATTHHSKQASSKLDNTGTIMKHRITKVEENNNVEGESIPQNSGINIIHTSIPEDEEEFADLEPISRKLSSTCSEGNDSGDFLLNDPWSSSDSELSSPVQFKRTMRSYSLAILNTFDHRHSAFKKLSRQHSDTSATSTMMAVQKSPGGHDPNIETNDSMALKHINTKRKSIGSSTRESSVNPAKSSDRDTSLSVLPNAYSSKATHFTPIIISSDKSDTKGTIKQNRSPVDSVKLKARIAMEAIKKGPQIPKKVPPPVTMLSDLENDAVSGDDKNSNSPKTKPLIKSDPEKLSTIKHQMPGLKHSNNTSIVRRGSSFPDVQQINMRKECISAVVKSTEHSTSLKSVDNELNNVPEINIPIDNAATESTTTTLHTASNSVLTDNETVDKNITNNIKINVSSIEEEVPSDIKHGSAPKVLTSSLPLVCSPLSATTSFVSVTASPYAASPDVHSAVPVNSLSTQALTSTPQEISTNTIPLPMPVDPLLPVSLSDRLSGTAQVPTGKVIPQLPNISGPIQLCQDPQTGFFHIIPVTIPVIGTVPTLQSSFSSDVKESLSPNSSSCSLSPGSAFSQLKEINSPVIPAKEIPITFLAKTDLTGLQHSSAFRPISNTALTVSSTTVVKTSLDIPHKHAKESMQIDKTKPTNKKDGNKKEYRKKFEKRHGVASKISHRHANLCTDSESSESTYQDPNKLVHNVRIPRYMKRTVRSNRVDVSHDSDKTRSKSQGRAQGKERDRSKSRDRAKSLDCKTHERLNGTGAQTTAQPLRKPNQDVRGRKRNTKKSADPRSHVAFNLKNVFDDTKPLDSLNTAISPTSVVSTVSRDSGVHMRFSQSSGEDVTALNDNPLKDALVGNKVLRKVVKLVRVAFAFDGYLENGIEDLQMAEYIVSLAHLRWVTFASAITEKFCDLYWEEDLLESLYEAVNGSLPEKTQRPLAMSPSRPRRKTEPITFSPSNTPDNLDSDDNASVIDDLLPADKPSPKKENKMIIKSNVVAHAKLFKETGGKRKDKQTTPRTDERIQVKENTKKLRDQKGVNPKDLTEKLNELEKIAKDGLHKEPVVAPRKKKRNKICTLNNKNIQETMATIPGKSKVVNKNGQKLSTKSNSLDSSQHELSKSMSSITSGSSHGSLSRSLDDPLDESASSVVSERSVQSEKKSGTGSSDEQLVQTHRKPKMLAASLPNPTTLVRHSSESSSGSGVATKHKLKSMMINQKLTHAESSLSLNSSSSGATNSHLGLGASKAESMSSIPSSMSASTGEDPQLLLNAGVLYGSLAVDPMVEDYTNKLVVNCETQQGIEAKIRVIDQELMMERKMRSKSQRFYQKMIEAQQMKGTDHKTMVIRVGKEIDEMTTKIDFLESAKRHLEMLYSEQWGLDHALLYSFATSMGQEPMYLHRSQGECPLLSFHYMKSGCTLQAGEPLGLFSYLYARQSLLEGYIHHFFSTYHYYATTDELYKFIVDKFCAARSMSPAQAESRTKILCRTIDVVQVWIENYYAVDFRPNLQLVNQLSEFIREKIMPVDAQGDCLLKLLEKRQQEKEEDLLLATLTRHRECGSHDKPKKRYSIREVLSVPTRALRAERMRGGITSCFSPPKKESGAESIYVPVQPVDKGFRMSEHTAQTLACQLTLMQQELFRKVHPVHYLNSRYHGIGVNMEADISIASPTLSRADDRLELDYPNMFVNTLGDEGLVHILLEHAREVSHWVAAEVVTSTSPKYQIAILCKFITIARKCYDMRNLATCVQIIDALDSLIVRQVPAWRSLPSKIGSSFEKLKAAKIILKGDGESLTQGNSHHDKPTLPCSLFLLMHLQRAEIGGFTLANGMYKWTKMKCIAKLVDQIRVFQEQAFTFEPNNELQELLRQRILQMNDHDIHSLAAQHAANFHQLAAERNSKRFKVTFKKVKTTLH